HAQAPNLQWAAGLSLVHALPPRLPVLERGLALSTAEISLPQRGPILPGEIRKALGLMSLGLFTSGCEWTDRVGEKFHSADPFDRLMVGAILATGAVGLYRLYRYWFDGRIEAYYHGSRPGEAHLNNLRLLEDPRETFYQT